MVKENIARIQIVNVNKAIKQKFKLYAEVPDISLAELFTQLIETTKSSGKLARFFLAKIFPSFSFLFRWRVS